jgi:enoyl-CoA hydratase/carnithine racemase
MASDSFEQLIYTKRGEVAEIVLNRPDALNALSLELYGELGDALIEASKDPEVQIVIITGAGRAFSTGGDLKQGDRVNRDDPRLFAEVSNRMLKAILESEKIIVAKVNGIAQAGGLLVVAACDLAIASDRATFKCPEALVGLWEPYGPALLVPQIGIKRAKQMLLTCETVSAAEAERIGLINRVVAHEALDAAAEELIEQLLVTGPKARSMFKRMTNEHIGEFDTGTVIEALGSEEGREGMAAFAEKRKPSWRKL